MIIDQHMNPEDAKAFVTMPRTLWVDISQSAGQHGRDPIDEIVYRLAASLDHDIVVEVKTITTLKLTQ